MDLSTCVNRYGPAPAAIAALRAIEPADILLHPYDAAPQLIDLYREVAGVSDGAMITGRGASEFIWGDGPRTRSRLGSGADACLHRLPESLPRPRIQPRR